jgi:hypothetical protein
LRSVNRLIRCTLCSFAAYILLLRTREVSGSDLGLKSAILTGLMVFSALEASIDLKLGHFSPSP